MTTGATHDPFGEAVSDYYKRKIFRYRKLLVHSNISDIEKINPRYLFRDMKQLPPLETEALKQCHGKVLDIGACGGSHSLILQKRGYDVSALEISAKCCNVMRKRGVKKVICEDVFKYTGESYDTLLLLMNGIGIAGTITGLENLLDHFKKLLSPGGKILFDSSDIDYMYYEKDGSKWMDLANEYHGQVKYTLEYNGQKGKQFEWLFIDRYKMKEVATNLGFQFTLLAEGYHYDYLGQLKLVK